MRYAVILTALVGWGWSLPGIALEADQVRGEIVSVSADEETMTLRVQEAGDARHASPGDVTEYRIPPDTEVRMEDPMESVLSQQNLTIDDLEQGTQVLLSFEDVGGEFVARDVSMGGADTDRPATAQEDTMTRDTDTDTAAFETEQDQRSSLPATASLLPVLALGGAGLGLVALVLRLFRVRR